MGEVNKENVKIDEIEDFSDSDSQKSNSEQQKSISKIGLKKNEDLDDFLDRLEKEEEEEDLKEKKRKTPNSFQFPFQKKFKY